MAVPALDEAASSLIRVYRRILAAGFVPVFLVILGIVVVQFHAQRDREREGVRRGMEDHRAALDTLLDSAEDHVLRMRRWMEAALGPYGARRVAPADHVFADALAPVHLLPWPAESRLLAADTPAARALGAEAGQLIGDPAALRADGPRRPELLAAASLFRLQASTHAAGRHLRWSYYFSASEDLVAIYPHAPAAEFATKDNYPSAAALLKAYFDYPIYRDIEPGRNPDGRSIWSAAYMDAGGAGLMVSLTAPVRAEGRFAGMVGTDVLLAFLAEFLATFPDPSANVLIVNREGQVLAGSRIPRSKSAVPSLKNGLPEGLQDLTEADLRSRAGTHFRHGGHEVLVVPVKSAPWLLVWTMPTQVLDWRIATRLLPALVLVICLTLALWMVQRMLRRELVRPAVEMVGYVGALARDPATTTPPLAGAWRSMADGVAAAFDDRRRFMDDLQRQSAMHTAVVDAALDAIITIDGSGKVLEFNPTALAIFGYGRDDVIGRALSELIVPARYREAHERGMARFIASGKASVVGRRIEIEAIDATGREFPVELAITQTGQGDAVRFTAHLRDISERLAQQARIEALAFSDGLTSLPNRARFLDRIEAARRAGEPFGVIVVELTRVRELRSSLGHAFGDEVLVTFGRRLDSALGRENQPARTGSEQFAILVPAASRLEDLDQAALATRAILGDDFAVSGKVVALSATVGATLVPRDSATDALEILREAEIAALQVQPDGGPPFALFSPGMLDRLRRLADLEIDLRAALEAQDQLWIALQPIVSLSDRRLAGFEALVRWKHPTLGNIPPLDFIPVAEQTGQILPLGRLVLRQACAVLREWVRRCGAERPPRMAVNLSARQLMDPDLVPYVSTLLADAGIEPDLLKLEITESTLMENGREAERVLSELRGIGVSLAIDDFGTGYSSLGYLHRLPVDTLKVDRSFVIQMGKDKAARSIVKAVVDLADALGLEVVAEGIETEADAEALRQLGCAFGQGYYFSRPLPAAEVADWIFPRRVWTQTQPA